MTAATDRTSTITTTTADDWHAVVRIAGELDCADAPDLVRELVGHLDAGRRTLHVDTCAATFVDSTVIGALVAIHERCAREHGTLVLLGVHGRVKRVLELSGLDSILLIDTGWTDPAGVAPE